MNPPVRFSYIETYVPWGLKVEALSYFLLGAYIGWVAIEWYRVCIALLTGVWL